MTRKDYWQLFKETGKIEYYLQYVKLTNENEYKNNNK